MFFKVEIGLVLSAANAAHIGLGRRRHTLVFEDVEVAAFAALLEDPLGKVDEGVAVGVGGDVDDVAEALGHTFEGHGSLVRGTTWGLVIQIPQDNDFLGLGGEHAIFGLHHVDIGGSAGKRWASEGFVVR